jgi:hypothetical protein
MGGEEVDLGGKTLLTYDYHCADVSWNPLFEVCDIKHPS